MRDVLSVAFALEQHVGHRTYAENLRQAVDGRTGLDATWIPVTYGADRAGSRPFGRFQPSVDARREIRSGLRSADADINVFNTQVPAALGGREARSRPYIVITDVTPVQYDQMAVGYGHEPDRPGPMRWWKHRVNTQVFAGAARCVGWSSWAASSIIDDYGVDPDLVSIVPPGVDTETWSPSPDRRPHGRPRILFVGGEFERKGGDLLLEAYRTIADRCDLWVVTKSAVPSMDGVHVVDDLGPNDVRLIELFRSACVFALPSRAETFGIAALEAASTGLPVVASRIGGLEDIVSDDETGFTIPVGDVDALAAALTRLVDDESLQRRMSVAARQRATERYDARRNADELIAIVRESVTARTG
ncbi:MAG: glycosyltransferase family 4 protein [Ilumatobacteraceae bacterium]|nr:glycosyltransferase family 4 protein [Ilumatobacteraceae bacterium]